MRLAQDRAETAVCDLGTPSFIDVSGVRVLVDAADYARGRGTRLAIVNVPPVASRVWVCCRSTSDSERHRCHGAEMEVNGSEVNAAAEGVRWTEVLRGARRGAVGAMAMTGMRVVTTEARAGRGTPPQAVSRQPGGARGSASSGAAPAASRLDRDRALGLWGRRRRSGRNAPKTVRARWLTGPAYGLLGWLGFELGIAPMLGLKQAKRVRPVDRLVLATGHPIYGLVLSELLPSGHD